MCITSQWLLVVFISSLSKTGHHVYVFVHIFLKLFARSIVALFFLVGTRLCPCSVLRRIFHQPSLDPKQIKHTHPEAVRIGGSQVGGRQGVHAEKVGINCMKSGNVWLSRCIKFTNGKVPC